jgi:hypothetical protein
MGGGTTSVGESQIFREKTFTATEMGCGKVTVRVAGNSGIKEGEGWDRVGG